MLKISFPSALRLPALVVIASLRVYSQDAPATAKQPLEHTLGAVTAVDKTAHTITVKDDKSGVSQTVQLADTKTLLKVEPGAKDLKSAVRIAADDLEVGDRVDVRGSQAASPGTLAARSVVLMSARDLQQAQQAQTAAWQHATAGTVLSVDAAAGKISLNVRTPEGPKTIAVETSQTTAFTRYSPQNPKLPAASQLAQIQTGDQARVIGDKNDDGSSVKAQRVYSGAFRTLSATVSALGADGKSMTVKDLASKKSVEISLNDDSTVRKLPPMMALMMARRFNPNFKPADAAATAGAVNGGQPAGAGGWQRGTGTNGGGPGGPGGGGMRSADISQMLERVPKISLADLKAGDALVISGVALGADNSHLLASSVIAGVEPILQSAPQRQGQSLGGDWGLSEMAVPQ